MLSWDDEVKQAPQAPRTPNLQPQLQPAFGQANAALKPALMAGNSEQVDTTRRVNAADKRIINGHT
ncbi:ribonucleotide-diphosphate reductase subunit beta, partial [Pseudomonas putida]|uniref:hypothetical protein n=1 Tax=Pseudomonas putida TaxID=303 RepID=UPI001F528F6B